MVRAGQEVIQRKGATFYAISMSVARIIRAVADDENRLLCVSSYIEDMHGVEDVCLSLPAIVGREGIREILPLPLDAGEQAALQHSAATLKALLREVGY